MQLADHVRSRVVAGMSVSFVSHRILLKPEITQTALQT